MPIIPSYPGGGSKFGIGASYALRSITHHCTSSINSAANAR